MVALATRIKGKGYLLSLSTLMTCLLSLDRPAFVDRIGPLHDLEPVQPDFPLF